MAFALKIYQQRCLDELAKYLRRSWELQDADTAFYEQARRAYHHVEILRGLPYICVRVPTGGGKTALAAYAVGIAAENLLRAEKCLVLWLAPTTQIVEQTLNALQNKRHPYRQALDNDFDGCITVMDIKSALNLQRGTLDSDTVIIVSTMAAMRVENTDGRKIYEDSGILMSNLDGLTDEQKSVLLKYNGSEQPARSLANLLRLRRPVIIVDEAHNARTLLSFESLARFNPSCILEFSATPNQDFKGGNEPSNVLTHVSAAELKAEDMIKLPIYLKAKAQWVEAVQEALDKRAELERIANEEEKITGQYIRPIVLFQAQRNITGEKNITYDILKKALIEEFKVPVEQIAVSTGTENELEGVDVLTREQKIRCIITVDKLREGWDCPFAYILCTISNLRSSTAVEQILGRILRMPYVTKRQNEGLNRAYAFATSSEFVESANALTEALVESGFERFEAKAMVKPAELRGDEYLPLFNEPVSETIKEKPNLEAVPENLRKKVSLRETKEGVEIIYAGPPITAQEADALKAVISGAEDKRSVERLVRKSHGQESTPAAMGEKFAIPVLAIRIDKELELFDDQFREVPWKVSSCDAALTEQDFSLRRDERIANIDVTKEGKIEYSFISDLEKQLILFDIHGPKSEAELTIWLDRHIRHPDITQTEASLFIGKMIRLLVEERGFPLEELILNRWRLQDAAEQAISHHRRQVIEQAYQRMLLPEFETPVEVDPTFCFLFDNAKYPASRYYDGPIKFNNHYYLYPGQMNGEEAECAAFIDGLEGVEYWVRNLDREDYSFWLPTSTDKFYPDFVVRLKDGRILVVEYKGADRWSDDDSREKRLIGEVWEKRSNGRCLFIMPKGKDWKAVKQKISQSGFNK
jgi:type III restriction enzyme